MRHMLVQNKPVNIYACISYIFFYLFSRKMLNLIVVAIALVSLTEAAGVRVAGLGGADRAGAAGVRVAGIAPL